MKKRDCTSYVAKTKALISCAVTVQLICDFDFAYAKSWLSHEAAHILDKMGLITNSCFLCSVSRGMAPFLIPSL